MENREFSQNVFLGAPNTKLVEPPDPSKRGKYRWTQQHLLIISLRNVCIILKEIWSKHSFSRAEYI